jgi:hypothetical protein
MMGGLIAATILTLTFLPALYALVFKVKAPDKTGAQSAEDADSEPTIEMIAREAA